MLHSDVEYLRLERNVNVQFLMLVYKDTITTNLKP